MDWLEEVKLCPPTPNPPFPPNFEASRRFFQPMRSLRSHPKTLGGPRDLQNLHWVSEWSSLWMRTTMSWLEEVKLRPPTPKSPISPYF